MPIVAGKAAIREFMKAFLAAPEFSLRFETAKVEVSRDGSFAFSWGSNTVSFPGPGGRVLHDKGKYVTVYRKGSDDAWKVVADIGNSDLPAPSAEPL
jgi:ketosteroid isomerase-like protein